MKSLGRGSAVAKESHATWGTGDRMCEAAFGSSRKQYSTQAGSIMGGLYPTILLSIRRIKKTFTLSKVILREVKQAR